MKRSIIAAMAGAWLALAAGAAVAEDLDAVLAKVMQGTKAPAMGMLVIRDFKVDGEAVRGVRRSDGSDPVKITDPWHLGSDGKAMTATMVSRLVDRGVLSWDTPLEKMLPELADKMNPQYRSVTLIQLLSHHTGLPHDVADEKALVDLFTDKSATSLTEKRLKYVARAVQDAPIGPTTAFNYSNTGFLLAAAIAERATGKSYEELMRQEVFAPLSITHAGFGLTHAGQPFGHIKGAPAKPEEGNPEFFAPAGNIYMPLDDWARFCIDQMKGANGKGVLLKPETYKLMQTAQPGGPYGLGWGAVPKGAGREGPLLTHSGSDGTWYAFVALFPTRGTGVLLTANAGEDSGAADAEKAAFKAIAETLAPPAS